MNNTLKYTDQDGDVVIITLDCEHINDTMDVLVRLLHGMGYHAGTVRSGFEYVISEYYPKRNELA